LVIYGAEAAENRLVASHVCDRLAEYGAPMRIASPLDEASVIADLRDALYMERPVRAILDENDDVAYRLRRVLSSLERPALILLDDFGCNYEACADGSPPMRPESRATLRLLVDAVRRSASGHRHRVVICSPFPLDGETGALLRQERVTVAPQNDAPRADLIRTAYGLADGNPYLRGRLMRLLDAQVDCERIFARLRNALPERAENVLNAELARMESHHLRRLLATGLLLQSPVPRAAFEAVCSEIPNLSRTLARALDLELINVTAGGEILCQAHGLADAVADAMPPNVPVLCRRAAEALRAAWREECERPTPEMVSEIKRLVGIAEKGLGDFGFRLEARSARQARLLYDWAVAAIARKDIIPALNCLQDEVFPAYGRLGDLHAQAVTAGRMADIRLRQGDWREALRIRREHELPVYERFNDAYAIAITKSQIADILCHFSGERSPDADK
jgi:hypothetical protein